MTRYFLTLLLLIFSQASLIAQENITEANYLRTDSLLWTKFEQQTDSLNLIVEQYPEKSDSIQFVYNELDHKATKKNQELAIKYASVPSGLQRLFMVRLYLTKDTLSAILNTLTPDMQNSPYGKSIREHIQIQQLETGASLFTFECTDSDREAFDWNITKGKQVLLIYGGMGCMGPQGREYLHSLYEKMTRDNFIIIVYWPCSSLNALQEIKATYNDYIFVSDFLQDRSPMKITYGVQVTPTCFLINKKGVIDVKCTGVHPELFDKFMNTTGNR